MHRRMKMFFATVASGALLAVAAAAPSAPAAPITCPNGQEAVHVNGHWFCENNGGNESGSGWHRGTGNKI